MAEIKYVVEIDDSQVDKTFDKIDDSFRDLGSNIEGITEQQKALLDSMADSYSKILGDALDTYKNISPDIVGIQNELTLLDTKSKSLAQAQRDLAQAYQLGEVSQEEYLGSMTALNIQQTEYTRKIEETKKALNDKYNAEKLIIGSTAEQTARVTQLKVQWDSLNKAQKESAEIGGKIKKEYQQLNKEIEISNKQLAGAGRGIASMLGNLKGLAGALGIAFGTQQLVQFATEIFDLTQKIEGVSLAFSRLGEGRAGLQKLREATSGTVDDLKLMQSAVEASNFGIPLDVLAKGIEFAGRRAQDTGKSVDYLVDSFVTGLGRKSTMILDNLGLSVIEIQEEVKKVGDFNIAVGNIIEREMARSGDAVDTLGTKVSRLGTIWQNFKIGIASFISDMTGELNTSRVDKFIEQSTKAVGDFDKASANSRKATIDNKNAEVEAIKQQIKDIEELRKAEDERLKGVQRTSNNKRREREIQLLKEQLYAENAVLTNLQDQNKALETQERISKGIVSDAELEAQIAEKRQQANQWVVKDNTDLEYKNKLLKEADALQKQLDSRSGKAAQDSAREAERANKQLQRQIEQDTDKRISLLDKWAAADASYLNKKLSRNEQEVQSVKDKYAQLRKEIERYNADTKTEKIDVSTLITSEQAALVAIQNKQAFDKFKEGLDRQQALFQEYEKLKTDIGEDEAKKRYENEIDFASDYEKQLLDRITELQNKQRTGQEDDQLKELQDRLEKDAEARRKIDNQNFAIAFEQAKTHSARLLDIEREYNEQVKALGENITAEQSAELKKRMDEKVRAENDSMLEVSDIMQKASREAIILTREQVKEQIKALESLLETADISEVMRNRVQRDLSGLKVMLDIGLNKSAIKELESLLQDTANAISLYTSTQGIGDITDDVLRTHPELKELLDNLKKLQIELNKTKKAGQGVFSFLNDLKDNSALKEIGDWGKVAADSFSKISAALGGADTQAGYLLGTMGELVGAASNVASALASGNPKELVSSLVGAVSSIFTIGKRTKEMNRQAREEVQRFYDEAKRGEQEYIALLRSRERQTAAMGKNSYRAIIEQLEVLKKQAPEIQQAYESIFNALQGGEFVEGQGYKHGTWFRKAKTWDIMASLAGSNYERLEKLYSEGRLQGTVKADFEALRKLRQELEAAGIDAAQLQNQLNQILTGTSVEGLAQGLADLFANGKRQAQDFGKSFEQIMANALRASFQAKILQDAIQPFYDELTEMMRVNELNQISDKQIDELRKKYEKLGEDYAKQWELIEQATGIDIGGRGQEEGLQGAIRRELTEATGGELVGIYRSSYDIEKRHFEYAQMTGNRYLSIFNSYLAVFNNIQVNTADTVTKLDSVVAELQAVNANTRGLNDKYA